MRSNLFSTNSHRLKLLLMVIGMSSWYSLPAQQQWDVTGTWNNLGFVIKSFYITINVHVTNEDAYTGAFQGYDSGNFPVTGVVNNTNITFYDSGVFGDGHFSGVILTNGMAGGNGFPGELYINDTGGTWHGFWFWFPGTTNPPFSQYASPSFTLQPASVVGSAGAPVSFIASASGHPDPTYQWRFNSENILNATNAAINLPATAVSNLGLYDVVASNSIGTNTSETASLSFLDMKCLPSLILYGPIAQHYNIQVATALGGGTNWVTITNIVLTASQPYIYLDPDSISNGSPHYYRAVPY